MSETIRGKTLDEAKNLVDNDRNTQYGEPIDDFSKVVGALNSYGYRGPGGRLLAPHDVPFVQIVVKLSRLVKTPDKEDSWVDVAGYAACGNEVSQQVAAKSESALPKEATWRWIPPMPGLPVGKLELHVPKGTPKLTEEALIASLAGVAGATNIEVADLGEYSITESESHVTYLWDAVRLGE